MKTVKYFLISMLALSQASSPLVAMEKGGSDEAIPSSRTTPTTSTSMDPIVPSGSDLPVGPSSDDNANSGFTPTDSLPASEPISDEKPRSASPTPDSIPSKWPAEAPASSTPAEPIAPATCPKCADSKNSTPPASEFSMPFFSPHRPTQRIYYGFKNFDEKHPIMYKGTAFTTLAVAATFLIGKGMENTSAFMKKVMGKPKHKETEQLRNNLATRSLMVILGLTGAFGLRYVINGFSA